MDILCHREQSNCVLNVLPRFHVADSVDCILLGLKPCWNEVTITHPFTIVNTGEREREREREIKCTIHTLTKH